MRDRTLFLVLAIVSLVESSLAILEIWPANDLNEQVLRVLFAYAPTLFWSILVTTLKDKENLRRWYFGCWIIVLILGTITLRWLLKNEIADAVWLGVQFIWGILSICAWFVVCFAWL